jgi:hypothetical protein
MDLVDAPIKFCSPPFKFLAGLTDLAGLATNLLD